MDLHLDTLLNLPNVTVESCTQQPNEVYLKLRFLTEAASCPHCQKISEELHQNRPILIRDLSVFGQTTYLKVPRRQFYCANCQRYFTESLPFMNEGRQYTQRYEEYIYQQVKQSSIEQVSRAERLTFERVEGIFKHKFTQKKTMDGQELSGLESMRSASAKGIKTSLQLSETLKLGNY
ncbi:transposase family protein [Chroococcidiopsis sp. FACHB-1243]|uniref:transposase family protein n=1 Tax=Chroococcidiopsis sp. [FACHB-1243] TaxID=2692781 RepID=UPI0017839551|nr:transposase family protein [Chroococcidiopsis sp. [FACHB-1243]]MBD2309814.1 transposase family protein [Chroococcidiopsis sp. [FACHB-1243]]